MNATAVVFAYHDVGCRCLSVLLARGVRVSLVVTHRDDPGETVWFASVERLAREAGIEVAMPDDPGTPAFVARLAAIAPDFLFSFYYRQMLSPAVLAVARRGAFNMHGWRPPTRRVHDLVRAVALPYPGAVTALAGMRVRVLRTWWSDPPAMVAGASCARSRSRAKAPRRTLRSPRVLPPARTAWDNSCSPERHQARATTRATT